MPLSVEFLAQFLAKRAKDLAEMDTTSIGIGLGLVFCASHSILVAFRQRTFNLGNTALIFLAGFSIPGGIALISAAISGNSSDLPSSWREYVAVAGIAAIGLATHHICAAFKDSWPENTKAVEISDQTPEPES